MNLLKVIFITVIFWGNTWLASIQAQEAVKVANAWVRMMPPSEVTSAAYLEIENNTDQALVLESASSPAVETIQIHYMLRENGMMKMGKVQDLPVPAHGKLVFDQAKYHLMLINIKEKLKLGLSIPIVLHFKNGQNVSFEAIVKEGGE